MRSGSYFNRDSQNDLYVLLPLTRSRIALLCTTLLLLGVFFSTSTPAQQATDSQAPEKLRLQLKWRHQFQFAGYYAAIDKGYFRAEGLEVELIEGKPGLDPIAELLAGKVDFAIGSPAVLINHQQGHPLMVVAAIFQHSPNMIITRRDSGLYTPQSLKGKRIMLTPETDPESMTMLVEEGVPLDSLTILPHNWVLDDLIAGSGGWSNGLFYQRAVSSAQGRGRGGNHPASQLRY